MKDFASRNSVVAFMSKAAPGALMVKVARRIGAWRFAASGRAAAVVASPPWTLHAVRPSASSIAMARREIHFFVAFIIGAFLLRMLFVGFYPIVSESPTEASVSEAL